MNIKIFLLAFFTMLINNPLYACDIINKRNVHIGGVKGIAGNCSNSGEKIDCYLLGDPSGGIQCHGPAGDNKGYYLNQLIDAVCGCTHEDSDSVEEQIERERTK